MIRSIASGFLAVCARNTRVDFRFRSRARREFETTKKSSSMNKDSPLRRESINHSSSFINRVHANLTLSLANDRKMPRVTKKQGEEMDADMAVEVRARDRSFDVLATRLDRARDRESRDLTIMPRPRERVSIFVIARRQRARCVCARETDDGFARARSRRTRKSKPCNGG